MGTESNCFKAISKTNRPNSPQSPLSSSPWRASNKTVLSSSPVSRSGFLEQRIAMGSGRSVRSGSSGSLSSSPGSTFDSPDESVVQSEPVPASLMPNVPAPEPLNLSRSALEPTAQPQYVDGRKFEFGGVTWQEFLDNSSKPYFFNLSTNLTVWKDPRLVADPSKAQPLANSGHVVQTEPAPAQPAVVAQPQVQTQPQAQSQAQTEAQPQAQQVQAPQSPQAQPRTASVSQPSLTASNHNVSQTQDSPQPHSTAPGSPTKNQQPSPARTNSVSQQNTANSAQPAAASPTRTASVSQQQPASPQPARTASVSSNSAATPAPTQNNSQSTQAVQAETPLSSSTELSPVVREGWLVKRGAKRKNWQKVCSPT